MSTYEVKLMGGFNEHPPCVTIDYIVSFGYEGPYLDLSIEEAVEILDQLKEFEPTLRLMLQAPGAIQPS
jgi:hypothetical protein